MSRQMTPRQRWLALLAGRQADRVPTDYQATAEVTARLLRELNCPDEESLYRKLDIDARRFISAPWKLPHHPHDPQADMWGVRYRKVDYGAGVYDEPCYHPLAQADSVAQVHAFRWPDPDQFDYSALSRAVAEDDGYRPIHCGCYEPFLLYGYMRGLQRAMEDLVLRAELADAILGHIFDFHYEYHRRMFAAGQGRIDLTYVAEDLGTQRGPLMSLQMYRRFLLPGQIKMAELARSFGIHVMYHSDGAVRVFLPDLIDKVGIEVLNPIQWRAAGMDREALVCDFGRHLVFHGSIDNQQTLPFGTVEDVIQEVHQSMEIYRYARWICAPCHNLQPITPTANILAMYQAVNQTGSARSA